MKSSGGILWYRELLNVRPKERCILLLCANYLKSNKARKCVISADINMGIHPLHHISPPPAPLSPNGAFKTTNKT